MIYISHRGNLEGKSEKDENNPDYILNAVDKGFDVEIDVWFKNDNFYLGHDDPIFKVDKEFLGRDQFWCHAKNHEALYEMSKINCHYFWHQEDDYTLTSQKFIWAYPEKIITKNSIALIFKFNRTLIKEAAKDAYGICTDYPRKIKSFLN